MFTKHVFRTFKKQWFSIVLLGFLLIISGFVYTIMSLSISAVSEESEAFFESTNQEDFVLHPSPYITENELETLSSCDGISNYFLQAIRIDYPACYDALESTRLNTLKTDYDTVDFEYRRYKDTYLTHADARNRIRIVKDADTINLSYFTEGSAPVNGTVAINEVYANANDLSIGDTVTINNTDYEITSYLLLPDYNLPILDNPYLFDGANQTLALLSDDDYAALETTENVVISGVFNETPDQSAFEKRILEHDFIESLILTENNMRSGAIYAELAGSQGMGLFISILIALIGIIIVGIMVSKTLDDTLSTLGVFKALGLSKKEMILPFIGVISLFSVIVLSIGYIIGYLSAPALRDLFLRFYLLPKGDITFNYLDMLIAIILPLLVVVSIIYFKLMALLKPPANDLIQPKLKEVKPTGKRLKKLFSRFNILRRLEFSLLIRQWVKVLVYSVGVFFAIFLIFMSLGMRDIFTKTLQDYYTSTDYESIVYCEVVEVCTENDGLDKAIELDGYADGYKTTLIALEPSNTTHALKNTSGESLLPNLNDGVVITKSYQDLNNVSIGETLNLDYLGERITLEITGVADIYPGAYIFMNRPDAGDAFFNDTDHFNRLYSNSRLDEEDYPLVIYKSDILNHVETFNESYMWMVYVLIASSGVMAFIVIYLLTLITVESRYYELSLFKVLGFNKKEMHQVLLSGYSKLNVIIFIGSIPLTMFSFYILRVVMIDLFDMYFPIFLTWIDTVITAVIILIISFIAMRHAKYKVAQTSLQMALKIHQN